MNPAETAPEPMQTTSSASGEAAPGDGRDGARRRVGQPAILRVARTHFLADGFTATSMQAIADAAGLTKAALYYHFKDKEDLFAAVLAAEMAEIMGRLGRELDGPGPLQARLAGAATLLIRTAGGDIGRLMGDMHACLSPDRLAAVRREHPLPPDALVPYLARAVETGELRADLDTGLLATFYFGLIFGQVALRTGAAPAKAPAQVTGMSPEAVGSAIAELFLRGAGA